MALTKQQAWLIIDEKLMELEDKTDELGIPLFHIVDWKNQLKIVFHDDTPSIVVDYEPLPMIDFFTGEQI